MTPIALAASRAGPALAAFLALAAPALAQPPAPAPAGPAVEDRLNAAGHKAADILTQPVRDVGLLGRDIPAPLQRASQDPYGLTESWSCADIDLEIAQLDGLLGPEPFVDGDRKESRIGKLAEAGGQAAVNSLIPFRAVVREVSGAAPAQRRLQAAVDVGYARRGFLRGVSRMRNCRPGGEPGPRRSAGEHD